MRHEVADAERKADVRVAIDSWRRAGAIPEVLAERLFDRYADDRVKLGPVLRVLVFAFSVTFATGAFGFVVLVSGSNAEKAARVLGVVFAVVCAAAAELLSGQLRRRRSGMESAAATLAVGFAMLGCLEMDSFAAVLLILAALSAAAAARWGYALLQMLAVGSVLASFVDGAHFRLAWIALPLVAGLPFLRASTSYRLAPPHRRGAAGSFLLLVAALWLATTIVPLDEGWIRALHAPSWRFAPIAVVRGASILATAAIPLLLLGFAIRLRRRLLLVAGLATAAASLASVAPYIDILPLWGDLALAGGAVLLGTELLRRHLDSGPARERSGFTVLPLGAPSRIEELGEQAAAVAVYTAEPRPPEATDPGWDGDGGRSGGGGASGNF